MTSEPALSPNLSPTPLSQPITATILRETILASRNRKKKKFFLALALPVVVSWLYRAVEQSNPVRTLRSLRRVPHHPGANTYVMDYYGDYKIEHLRRFGLRNVRQLEDSYIEILFPPPVAWVVRRVKRLFLPAKLHRNDDDPDSGEHHCSTVTLNSGNAVYFGRNFDWDHDATLILRVHDGNAVTRSKRKHDNDDLASIAVIDLHYLNLNRPNLVDETALWQRIPLLFAPYYVMDGMNRHGVAISDMTVPEPAHPPQHNNQSSAKATPKTARKKPDIIHSTLARIILDYAKTTTQAVDLMHDFQIHFPYVDIHFMVADAMGDARIVEFLHGQIRVTSTDLPWHVSTNDIVWNKSEEEKDDNCYRYQRGSGLAEELFRKDNSGQKRNKSHVVEANDAVHVTRSMAVDGWTMWTSVYELKNGEFWHYYKMQPDAVYRDTFPR